MKFMFAITTLSHGGAERVVSVISNALVKQGEEVTVVKYFSTDEEYPIEKKVHIVNLSSCNYKAYKKTRKIKLILEMRKAVMDYEPDVIIPFTYPVAQLTEIATLGLSVNVFQSIRINPSIGPSEKWKRALRDRLVYKSKCTFVQNYQQKEYFSEHYRNKIHILYNPVSDVFFTAVPKSKNEEFIVCALGRLTDQKNYPLLIDSFATAFRNESKAKLRIYGDGDRKETLEKYIKQIGMSHRIKLMGRTSDVKSVFQESDLYVLSSDWEGMPNALIEAMACHVLCISTDCPTGPSDLIENGVNGFLVPVNNVKAMADTMYAVYSMSYDKRLLLSENGKQKVKELCSSDNIAKQLISICKKQSIRGIYE